MRAVVQRVSRAEVRVGGKATGKIKHGLCVFLGVHRDDEAEAIGWMAEKLVNLRIFEDDSGKMNRSLLDVGGSLLVVSQFTLYGDCRKGRRPSFVEAAEPGKAKSFYEKFIETARSLGVRTHEGVFQAMMDVELTNQGPVTLVVESRRD
ncbi:MAG: D-aminoacyl-tRNA deacylase [Thermovirgaceae bacterium]